MIREKTHLKNQPKSLISGLTSPALIPIQHLVCRLKDLNQPGPENFPCSVSPASSPSAPFPTQLAPSPVPPQIHAPRSRAVQLHDQLEPELVLLEGYKIHGRLETGNQEIQFEHSRKMAGIWPCLDASSGEMRPFHWWNSSPGTGRETESWAITVGNPPESLLVKQTPEKTETAAI